MTTPQKAKGSQWERDVAKYFNERGFPKVERRYGAGNTQDKGDLNGLDGFALECKNVGKITLSTIIEEALVEQRNAHADYGVAIVKRRNRGAKEAYVVMTLEQWISLLRETRRV
jgi:Holliday junction resolvase